MVSMSSLKKICFCLGLFLFLPTLFQNVHAITYDLFAPQEELTRGAGVQFTIYIDTEGETVTNGQIGVTYETQYLEYLSTTPGRAMTTVTVTPVESGKFLLTGTNTAGFKGNDVFAYLNFKIIATAPGSTQLCSLWAPTPTPSSIAPTTPPGTPQPTTPRPTALPKTGDSDAKNSATTIGGIFILAAVGLFVLKNMLL